MFIGREKELKKLKALTERPKSSFVAIYGQRRIGKTELVRHFCRINGLTKIEFSGKVDHNRKQQIKSFVSKIKRLYKKDSIVKDWNDAFIFLEEYLETLDQNRKVVVFLDELPWLDTAKSGFIGELSDFWNDFCSQRENIILIVCGSAASYMLKKVIHNRGSLHGRLTDILPLRAFDLYGVKQMLQAKGCRYSDRAIVDTYIALGGVAKYIEALDCHFPPNKSIDSLCFREDGLLKYEYEELFSSLFRDSKTHYEIMNQLTSKWTGFTQRELSIVTKISSVYLKVALQELVASGFVSMTKKFNQQKRDILYRATDSFSYFYHKWIKDSRYSSWESVITTPSYKSWSGFAFENICHLHIEQIKKVLGISGVPTQTHYWNYRAKKEQGTQIDMLIEHTNGSKNIDIVECKYYNGRFVIDKSYKEKLLEKINIFDKQTKHKYNIRLIMITSNGIEKNEHYGDVVNESLELGDIMGGI
jgi:AAA+ ATPase superfamily predicted ATPase